MSENTDTEKTWGLPTDVLEKFRIAINDRNEMDKVLLYCLTQFRKVDRFFEWKPVFQNMINLGILDEDDSVKEFRGGLIDFYEKLLSEIRQVESSDLSFISKPDGEMDKSLFHDDMVVGVCLLNDVQCYSEEENLVVKMIGGCILRKYKHDNVLSRLTKMGDHSHLFEDPIDVIRRDKEEESKICEETLAPFEPQ